jgi:thymidylate synthase (FAD)
MRIELFDDDIGAVEYVSHMGSDLTVVNAARVSFAVEKDSLYNRDEKLIKYLLEHNHTSPFEHCAVTMRFTVLVKQASK